MPNQTTLSCKSVNYTFVPNPNSDLETNKSCQVSRFIPANSVNARHEPANKQLDQRLDDWILNDPLGWHELDSFELKSFDPSYINNSSKNSTIKSSIDNMNEHNHLIPAENPSTVIEPEIEFNGDTSRENPHFKPLLPKPINKNESGRQLILDTETTGLDPLNGDRIIEVGIIELVNRKFTGEKLHVYINPLRAMDEEVIRIHGISEAFLKDKPTFEEVAQPIYDFMMGAEVIAHNAKFDINFLNFEFEKSGIFDFVDNIKVTDSVAMAKQLYPGQKTSLDALVRRLNVGKMDRTFHGALLDSEILAEVYLAMTGGQVSLAIEEDISTDDGGAHENFNEYADLLISDKDYSEQHLKWISQQLTAHPTLLDAQGINCFYMANNLKDSKYNGSLLLNPNSILPHYKHRITADNSIFITTIQ